MSRLCVIFDLDGTLVDSEPLYNQALLDLLPELTEPLPVLVSRYRGCRLTLVMSDLATRLGYRLPENFEQRYRERVFELMNEGLQPMIGVADMLDIVPFAKCVASNGPLDKIHRALRATGLSPYFGENIFSAYEIRAWKPDPQLFLHAASIMGFDKKDCVVVEDSDPGISAASAAGMRSIRFAPDAISSNHTTGDSIRRMVDLPALLDKYDAA